MIKTVCSLALLILCAAASNAQINYQPGYYIRTDGTKTTCLIKDYGWGNNPTHILTKSSPDAEPVTLGPDSIIEFSVGNSKYRRFDIDVDTTAQEMTNLGSSATPQFRHETAFIKVLVEGRASLYLYRHQGMTRFYCQFADPAPQPLICKKYMSVGGAVMTNQGYVKQLRDSMICTAEDFPDPSLTPYNENGLSHYFDAYNHCVQSPSTNYWEKRSKTNFHLHVRAGLDLSNLSFTNSTYAPPVVSYSYGSSTSFRIGAEGEFILGSNRRKWALVVEPAYHSYSSSTSNPGLSASYSAWQVNAGLRYFLYTGGAAVFYATAEASGNIPVSGNVRYVSLNLATQTHVGAIVNAGCRIGDRFGIELLYQFPCEILKDYEFLKAKLSGESLVLSCRIL